MKITKRQLRRIIKESMRGPGAEMSAAEIESRGAQSFEAVEDLLEVLATQFGVREDDAPTYLRQIADRLEGK